MKKVGHLAWLIRFLLYINELGCAEGLLLTDLNFVSTLNAKKTYGRQSFLFWFGLDPVRSDALKSLASEHALDVSILPDMASLEPSGVVILSDEIRESVYLVILDRSYKEDEDGKIVAHFIPGLGREITKQLEVVDRCFPSARVLYVTSHPLWLRDECIASKDLLLQLDGFTSYASVYRETQEVIASGIQERMVRF